jgi:hypothetical protein
MSGGLARHSGLTPKPQIVPLVRPIPRLRMCGSSLHGRNQEAVRPAGKSREHD